MKQLTTCKIGSRVYSKGMKVSQQFPRSIQGTIDGSLTTIITGTIDKIVETRNAAFATILQDDGVKRLVVLG